MKGTSSTTVALRGMQGVWPGGTEREMTYDLMEGIEAQRTLGDEYLTADRFWLDETAVDD